MARIKINKDDLMMAMEDHGGFITYVLDRETGTVLFFPEDGSVIEDGGES